MGASPAAGTARALTTLVDALEETLTDLGVLVERATQLRDQVHSGRPLREAMPEEVRPLIISKLVDITDRLHEAGGAVRRAEALQLRAEGCTQDQIAELFDVSRQRVAKLLQSPAVKPTAHRRRRA